MPAKQRRALLEAYRADLKAVYAGESPSDGWPDVFGALARVHGPFELPWQPMDDLLSAFLQDTDNPLYASRMELLEYCARSANPVGRLMLHLFGQIDELSQQQSDQVCTALQLINFWQDLSVDLPRGRIYLPLDDLQRHGMAVSDLSVPGIAVRLAPLVHELCEWTQAMMCRGAPLAQRIPGRAGWELRLVVLGGLRILEKIGRMHHLTGQARPTLVRRDAALLLWRSLFAPCGAPTR